MRCAPPTRLDGCVFDLAPCPSVFAIAQLNQAVCIHLGRVSDHCLSGASTPKPSRGTRQIWCSTKRAAAAICTPSTRGAAPMLSPPPHGVAERRRRGGHAPVAAAPANGRPRRCALCCVLTVLAAVVFASITLATLPEEEQQMDEGAAPLVTTEGRRDARDASLVGPSLAAALPVRALERPHLRRCCR